MCLVSVVALLTPRRSYRRTGLTVVFLCVCSMKQLRERVMKLKEDHDHIYHLTRSDARPSINWGKIIDEKTVFTPDQYWRRSEAPFCPVYQEQDLDLASYGDKTHHVHTLNLKLEKNLSRLLNEKHIMSPVPRTLQSLVVYFILFLVYFAES